MMVTHKLSGFELGCPVPVTTVEPEVVPPLITGGAGRGVEVTVGVCVTEGVKVVVKVAVTVAVAVAVGELVGLRVAVALPVFVGGGVTVLV